MKLFIKRLLSRIRGEVTPTTLIKRGMKVGQNFHCMNGVWIDPGHCWLIEFGDNVTLAPRVTVLAHDASPQAWRKVTKVGRITVGNNVFIGAGSILLPGITIGNNVIIGAGSIVTGNIPDNTVAAGNPCRPIIEIDKYLSKVDSISLDFGKEYLFPNITDEKKHQMNEALSKTRFGLLVRK